VDLWTIFLLTAVVIVFLGLCLFICFREKKRPYLASSSKGEGQRNEFINIQEIGDVELDIQERSAPTSSRVSPREGLNLHEIEENLDDSKESS